jgi:hypothetical protein
MSAATDTLESLIGNHLLRTATWAKPAAIYVALFTTLPAEDGTGGVEVTGGNYARILRGPADADWTPPVSGDGVFSNAAAIIFASPNANWGNVLGAGIFDASTGGTLLARATLDTARNIVSGDPAPNFPAGALKFIIA